MLRIDYRSTYEETSLVKLGSVSIQAPARTCIEINIENLEKRGPKFCCTTQLNRDKLF